MCLYYEFYEISVCVCAISVMRFVFLLMSFMRFVFVFVFVSFMRIVFVFVL